jgi:hypothetical protein
MIEFGCKWDMTYNGYGCKGGILSRWHGDMGRGWCVGEELGGLQKLKVGGFFLKTMSCGVQGEDVETYSKGMLEFMKASTLDSDKGAAVELMDGLGGTDSVRKKGTGNLFCYEG